MACGFFNFIYSILEVFIHQRDRRLWDWYHANSRWISLEASQGEGMGPGCEYSGYVHPVRAMKPHRIWIEASHYLLNTDWDARDLRLTLPRGATFSSPRLLRCNVILSITATTYTVIYLQSIDFIHAPSYIILYAYVLCRLRARLSTWFTELVYLL